MDCRSHTWRETPPMLVAREFQSACVLDGKIYIPSAEIFGGFEYKSVEYEGTVYVRPEAKDVTYMLHKGRWRTADLETNSGWGRRSSSYCVIENVFYRSDGLKKLHSLTRFAHINFVNYGGKMTVLWEEYVVAKNHKETMIWCAENAIEKRQNREIWGMVEWVDIVLSTTNEPYGLAHVLATTI
ncbi:PREDICTED: F-box/kelch-repeat protein At4g23580-like [Camelina sativa]|uniref:F-box/kelch-repeat protein At4g23580-like n=1 Tax=Camelina sativa TaxID=90675 RepID=A0ABM0SZJ5_CAMSA|nr:PREDICTED: F-box/kelch-repeat protein At4g23580-like [Camelina sativa]